MYFSIVIFIISLILLIGFLGIRLWQIRKGHVLPEDSDLQYENPLEIFDFATLRNMIDVNGRKILRRITLETLKISIKASYFVKRKLDAIVAKVQHAISKHEKKIQSEVDSGGEKFLNTISEYKDKMKRKHPHGSDTM